MAYRTFSQPTPMRAAKFEGMPNLINAIQTNQLLKSRKDAAQAKAKAEQVKKTKDLLAWNERTDLLPTHYADYNKEGERLSAASLASMQDSPDSSEGIEEQKAREKHLSDGYDLTQQAKIYKQNKETIAEISKQDDWYIGSVATAYNVNEGTKPANEIDMASVTEKLTGDDTFNYTGQLSSFIVKQKASYSNEVVNPDGTTTTTTIKEAFLDDNGKTVITPTNVITYLDSHRMVRPHFNKAVDLYLEDGIKSLKGTNLQELEWMKDKSMNDLKSYFYDNPDADNNPLGGETQAQKAYRFAEEALRDGVINDVKFNVNGVARRKTKGEGDGDGGIQIKQKVQLRWNSLFDGVVGRDQASINTITGGLEGVKEVTFVYTKGDTTTEAFPLNYTFKKDKDKVKEKPNWIRITYTGERYGMDVNEMVYLPIRTKKEEMEAMTTLNPYADEKISGTADAVSNDIIIEMAKSDAYFTKEKESPFDIPLKEE